MTDADSKKTSPPYVSYSSFTSFIKGLGGTHVPSRIDKTVMSNYSGSVVYALLPALQWLGLIDEHGTPDPMLHSLASADEDEYKSLLAKLVKDKYHFLFNSSLDLSKASSGQVIEAFKQQDITGSTVTKCMSFFLSIAKAAGIAVSPHVKAPTVKRKPVAKKNKPQGKPSDPPPDVGSTRNDSKQDRHPEGTEKISFKMRDMPDVVVYFPKGMEAKQVDKVIDATVFNLEFYYGIDHKRRESKND